MTKDVGVSFQTSDVILQRVFDAAEQKCRSNLKRFGDDLVLVEGYKKADFSEKIIIIGFIINF